MNPVSPVVFVVDDDDVSRSLLLAVTQASSLKCQPFASAAEFLEYYDPRQPGCLILDVFMPGMSGLALQNELNRRGAVIPVIFITGHDDVPSAVDAIRHGAFNYLVKPFSNVALIDNLHAALAHDRQNRKVLAQSDVIGSRISLLTPRERQVLDLIVAGRANKVIALDLSLSQRTVELYRSRVKEKMGASSVAQLVRMVMDFQRSSTAAPVDGNQR
jgi:two-component system, LuxR family, response regulator FixJ